MDDHTYIQRTLELAEKGAGLTSPGAMVGAVIVKDGRIVGEGFYTYDGVRHAERIALEQAFYEAGCS
jgi:diaminohydroxyphosphoribosylaminopyrimidine deaminase/5-amino-6-(5-phosphoribosylamino)uracil reductase